MPLIKAAFGKSDRSCGLAGSERISDTTRSVPTGKGRTARQGSLPSLPALDTNLLSIDLSTGKFSRLLEKSAGLGRGRLAP